MKKVWMLLLVMIPLLLACEKMEKDTNFDERVVGKWVHELNGKIDTYLFNNDKTATFIFSDGTKNSYIYSFKKLQFKDEVYNYIHLEDFGNMRYEYLGEDEKGIICMRFNYNTGDKEQYLVYKTNE